MALARPSLEDCLRPSRKREWERRKGEWFPQTKEENRTPGLFKKEFEGHKMIALCSKSYIAVGGEGCKTSAKGVQKGRNDLRLDQYYDTLFKRKECEFRNVVSKTGLRNSHRHPKKRRDCRFITTRGGCVGIVYTRNQS